MAVIGVVILIALLLVVLSPQPTSCRGGHPADNDHSAWQEAVRRYRRGTPVGVALRSPWHGALRVAHRVRWTTYRCEHTCAQHGRVCVPISHRHATVLRCGICGNCAISNRRTGIAPDAL
eukprot:366000-Chlamydomonas_euryale.AAC.38